MLTWGAVAELKGMAPPPHRKVCSEGPLIFPLIAATFLSVRFL